ncbi:MAG: response regulator [Saprospiraceae bacterium]|nr:response regulator [Saprospiraceae bacterium]
MGGIEVGGKYILIIEDNPGDAHFIEILLQDSDFAGCPIVKATCLEKGMEALSSGKEFVAVLLDLSLPDNQGLEGLEKLLQRFPQTNIIVMTGMEDKSTGLKAVQFGAQDYLVKGKIEADILERSIRFSIERNGFLQRLEETQRLSKIGNWEFHEKTHHFFASDEMFRIFNFAKPTSVKTDFDRPDHPFHLLDQIHKEAGEQGNLIKDFSLVGEPGLLEKVLFVRCNVSGNPGNRVFNGIVQDITERRTAKREYAKSKERYLQIFTQSRDAIYISTLTGKLVDCNQAMGDLFKREKKEMLQLETVHSLFQPQERKNEFLLKLKYQRSVRDFEIEIKQPDGEIRYCLISANLQLEEGFTGYNAILRDITERKQTEELIKAKDMADQSARLREQFIASISHEMRTPMNAILGMSNLLDKTHLDGEQKELIGSIKQSSEVLLGIVNDILEIATIQNGKITFENELFQMHELLNNLTNVMQYKAREKNLELKLEIEPGIPTELVGDKLRLNQILFNLVGNAIKFTDEGKVLLKVEKLTDFEGGIHMRFSVADTGIGIPTDKLDAVFESFTRIRSKNRVFEGTGLGLAIAKSLVEQQGGKIGVESEVGKGSLFFFDLIFENGLSKEKLAEKEEAMQLDETKSYRILLVEDHKMNQLVARKTLLKKWENMEVVLAENGKEAIEKLEQEDFDLILMDVQMPVMDGYQATHHIRHQMKEELTRIPILAMTAHAHLSQDGNFKKYGMDDFVLKPFQPEELFTKIAEYLNK